MSAADRVSAYAQDFAGYADNTLLHSYPGWLSLGGPSPFVYNNGTTAAIFPDFDTVASAWHEGSYPQDQYAMFSVDNASGGAGTYPGCGVILRFDYLGTDYWHYIVMANASDNTVTISKVDSRSSDSELSSTSVTIAQLDEFWCEVVSDGGGGCDIRVHNAADTIIATASDGTELVGAGVGVVVSGEGAFQPGMLSCNFGTVETQGNRRLDTVNPTDIVESKGTITLSGSGLSDASGAHISLAGARPFDCNILSASATQITLSPVDISQTSLPYGTLTMTVEHATDADISLPFTMQQEAGWQYVTLLGATDDTLMLTDTPATNGDILEIPNNDGFSTFILEETGDVTYDSAANQGMTHTRRLYDADANSWDSGQVTINQVVDGEELLAPSWRSTPSPPDAVVGTPYSYDIGYLVDGSRPMTLSQAPGSNSLPQGLSYNSSSYPEKIEGTITSGTGTVTVSNIITRATNGA